MIERKERKRLGNINKREKINGGNLNQWSKRLIMKPLTILEEKKTI